MRPIVVMTRFFVVEMVRPVAIVGEAEDAFIETDAEVKCGSWDRALDGA
jgi:hypothetical protein